MATEKLSSCHNSSISEVKGKSVCDVCGHEVGKTKPEAVEAAPVESASETRRKTVLKGKKK